MSRLGVQLSSNTFLGFVLISFIIRGVMLFISPPLIDVFYYDKQASELLLGLVDPYGHTYVGVPDWLMTPGAQNVFTYMPGVIAFLTPFDLIGDIRLGLITADFIVAWGLFLMMGKYSKAAVLIYLLVPFTILFCTLYPNNTLVAMAFMSLALVFEKAGKDLLSATFMGLSLSSSQFSILVYPFFVLLKFRERKLNWIILSIVSSLPLILPFLIWNTQSFIHDVLFFQLTRPVRTLVVPSAIGYTLNPSISGLVYTLFGVTVSPIYRIVATLILLLYFLFRTSDLRSLLINSSIFLTLTMFILPNDFSWQFLELPFQLVLVYFSLT